MGQLEGLKVLDLTSFIPGPFLTLALADHGAQVTKIEMPPGGDAYRQTGLAQGGHTALFRAYNRGKDSLALNLKDPADRARFLALADDADVIVEGARPGVARRLGVDYDTISARNPRIVYCSISAFGQDGPDVARPAHDLGLAGATGFLSMNLGSDGRPTIPAIPVSDVTAGLFGLSGVLMALLGRERTGKGDFLDISMQETLLASMLNILPPALTEDRQPDPRQERTTGGAAFYALYDCADGRQIALAGQEPKFVTALLGHLGRTDLADLCQSPGPHQAPVFALLTQTFGEMTASEAGALCDRLDLCWGPVNSLPEALVDPQIVARGLILTAPDGTRHVGTPIRFRNQPADLSLDAPQLDADA
ncbi:CaiB/BaiF CoA transferase family protein [Tropicimonas isoalkanivorans]|uniref:Crotonobetainyl-CoA:carnitine CoA-transferase CaiB n=1 Tax=Tropicimonas isoalkanivorans TaxID=441112 RepID=A0A1I1HZA8_9RHOB|nr:CoA transferase [Tropicimonas isoalkanivorans]SFC29171.1 Crotonobetainyl-CoA:carnitine CoA-transferase CaiB [Tropicimonas isoalkanivorans]